jgi:hypothetical protein
MPLLYEIPLQLQAMIGSQQASLIGAIIKDNATGQILGHVQQASGLSSMLTQAFGSAVSGGFSPLAAISVVQNETLRRGVAELKDGMILVQNLQYGTLALSGLGLGVSIAGFAATLAKLRAIEMRIDQLSDRVEAITADRRDDDLKTVFADVSGDLQNIETLTDRRDPQRVAEQLQLSLSRSTRKIEGYFVRLSDVRGKAKLPLDVMDRLWALAAAIRLCQEAAIQALFAADELEVAEHTGRVEMERQLALMGAVSPDILSRMVSRGEQDPVTAFDTRKVALAQARILADGLKGGVQSLAGQVSTARALRSEGISGLQYLREARSAKDGPFLCLLPSL